MSNADFILGLIAGEGCFYVELNKNKRVSHNVYARPAFTLGVKVDDPDIVHILEEEFGFGEIVKKDNSIEIRVRNKDSIEQLIDWLDEKSSTLFERTDKHRQYEDWKTIRNKIENCETEQDMIEIVTLSKSLSNSTHGKSKEDWHDLIRQG
mgnify:CR=1 FL=1